MCQNGYLQSICRAYPPQCVTAVTRETRHNDTHSRHSDSLDGVSLSLTARVCHLSHEYSSHNSSCQPAASADVSASHTLGVRLRLRGSLSPLQSAHKIHRSH